MNEIKSMDEQIETLLKCKPMSES